VRILSVALVVSALGNARPVEMIEVFFGVDMPNGRQHQSI
jgi:hypothetical protein